ncbi:MarR family winged helix-turn-helix transcriptional regulator [Streptomyces inhibens]|uniref:MarR family winged helix-turn-helix transcriptional regulator n=1 Tax=Streptomyces inhibens TaxID=2293571 RepID=UPI0037B6235F
MTGTTQLPNVREQRPLGYWLKYIDGAIETRFDRLFADDGLTRRGWQVLNTVSYGPITVAEIDETMAAFLSGEEPTMRPYVERFAELDWVRVTDADGLALTEEGKRTHQRVSEQAGTERVRMMECLSHEDFQILMDLLQRIATHLDGLATETPRQ